MRWESGGKRFVGLVGVWKREEGEEEEKQDGVGSGDVGIMALMGRRAEVKNVEGVFVVV